MLNLEFPKKIASVSGIMVTVVVSVRVAFSPSFEKLQEGALSTLQWATVLIFASLILSLFTIFIGRFKKIQNQTYIVLDIISFLFLFIGSAILIGIIMFKQF